MRSSALFALSLLPLLASFVQAEHGHARRHHDVALRARGDVQVHKREFDNARLTFYDVGQGACGNVNVASDFIVALNTPQYGDGYPGPNCFKSITITANGKTTSATIMDECPGCPYGGLDMSRGLFDYFADESVGVLYGTWSFNDGSSDPSTSSTSTWTPPTSTWEPPTSTWTPPTSTWEPPTSTWTPPTSTWTPPSSTWTPPSSTWTPSSSSAWSSSSIWSSSSSSAWSSSSVYTPSSSSTWTSSSAAPTISSTASDPQNIDGLNQAIIGIGGLIVAGAGA